MKKFVFPVLLLLLYSCSTITVTADYDKDVDFSTYKTFSLMSWREDNNKLLTPFDKKRIEEAVKNEMTARNYTYQETGGELAISVFIILEDRTSYNSYTDYYGRYGYYYGTPWGWGGPARTTVSRYDYTQGTIIFNVFDAKEKKLVWQGTAIGEVDSKPANNEKNIKQVVNKVFIKYPINKSVK
ncbi:MAG: DUF4136 domain-containing protein [Chlorobi bacterium]|nr:DUF4136 domain-containing protein [Chlorobiota bacterium]